MHGERLETAIGRVESVVTRVLRAIAGRVARLVGGSPSAAALSEDDLQVIRHDWVEAVTVEIAPAVAGAYRESAEALAKEFADAGRPVEHVSLEAPSAADFLDAATNRLVGVADTLWEVARNELADGVRAGEGIEELAARLQEAGGFGEARAHTIARTEVVAAANAASLAQAMRLGDPSLAKEWLATMDAGGAVCDERTRAAHCDAHEQVQPLGEPFAVGDTWLMYPGQPIGPADSVINCRCSIGFVVGDNVDEPLTAGGPDGFHLPGRHDQAEHGRDRLNAPDSIGDPSSGSPTAATGVMGRDHTSVGETVRKYGAKSLTLAAHDNGELSLTDDTGNKVRLSRREVDQLRSNAINSDSMEVGDEFTITHTEDRDGVPYSTLRLLVTKTAIFPDEETADGDEGYLGDTVAVHLAPNDDPDFDELRTTAPVEMPAGHLADLTQELIDLTSAGRVDTGHGQVDMFSDGRWFVLRPVDGPELRLNRRGLRALDGALDAVIDDLSESEDPDDGDTAERTIDTNIGQVTVSLTGGLGVGELRIRVPDRGVEIVVAPARQPAFFDQLGPLSEALTASAARRKRSTMRIDVSPEVVTAAAEVHTGAMVALRPSAEDAERLAVEGGESADQLHTTLAYLGDASGISAEAREQIIDAVFDLAEGKPPLTVEGFAVSAFNPGDTNDRDPCIVLGLSGEGLDKVHSDVAESLVNLQAEPAGFTLPDQHAPWQPHVTLIYTDDVSMVEQMADRVGPITFDAIRVAFAGEVFDIPLGAPEGGEGDGEEDDDFDWDAYIAATIEARFQSRMPPQLQRFWIRRLSLGTPGSFRRCVRELRRYFPNDTEGLCANLYHEATGRWPGRKKSNAAASDTDGEGADAFVAEITDDGMIMAEAEPAMGDPTAALPGEHFHTRVLEGVSTGMRQFAPGAITWRTPPFAYHWQWKSSAHNGLPETIQVGLITRAERDRDNVHFWGRLDLRSPEGLDYARRLVEGFARWSSVGADESVKDRDIDVEYVLEAGMDDPDEDPEIDLMTFNQYRVAEISGVSVPALADATVEPTQELIDTLTAMGVIEPAQVAEPPAVEEVQEDEMVDFATEQTPAGDEPEHVAAQSVIVAAGHTITIPDVPPADWFAEPTDVEAMGALTITDEGRVYGYLAPAGVAHRSFRSRRVEVPRGNVDYSRWMGGEAIVAGGGRVVAGPITMNCGHMPPTASSDPGARMEHYDNTCSVVAQAAIGENSRGVWIAGALLPGVTAEQVSRMLACRLSGDWAPHPEKAGMREFVAALLVPVPGFPMARSMPSTLKVAAGALVAAAVPVQFADDGMEETVMGEPTFVEGDTVRVVDDGIVGNVVAVHSGPVFAVRAVEGEPPRWHVAEELEPADIEPVAEDVVAEELVASAAPDLRPVLDRLAKGIGRDRMSRMDALRRRIHSAT